MNEQFINGAWYEQQYINGSYRKMYIDQNLPVWAKEMNQHCVDLAIAYSGIEANSKILDLGSGVGNHMRAFQNRGYNTHGIEISKTAVEVSGQKQMINGSIQNMDCFENDMFDLVYSAALFEHLDKQIVPDCISECCRVGKRQVHLISQDKGHDPSHINVKPAVEWLEEFKDLMPNNKIFLIPNILEKGHPFIIIFSDDTPMPYQLTRVNL